MRVSSKYTRVAAAQTDAAIESEQTITVYTIVCANTNSSAETVTLEEADGSTVIQTIQVPANNTVVLPFPTGQLFHRGLNVTTPTTTTCTVYHSQGGS